MKTIEEVKSIRQTLKETAEEIQEILSTHEQDTFAIGFLKYVEDTYTKLGDQYFFKNPGISHVHRSIDEVLDNYKCLIKSTNK